MTVSTVAPKAGYRGRIYDSILETIGSTPLVRFKKLAAEAGVKADIIGKLEFFNPLSSVKDRIGLAMIEAAEATGKLVPGSVIIEPTSGNTGIALAFVAAAKGYRLILTMAGEHVAGAAQDAGAAGRRDRIDASAQGHDRRRQAGRGTGQGNPPFGHPAAVRKSGQSRVHMATTAEEIWTDTDGKVDIVVSGVGTGGTITGIGKVLKSRKPSVKMVAVEPEDSPVLSGGAPGPHKIQGIGPGFVPGILDRSVNR